MNSSDEERLMEFYNQLNPDDVSKFRKKFDSNNLRGKFHTFRELEFGVHFISKGFNLRHEVKVNGKTPDWVIIDENEEIIELVDIITLHQRYEKEKEIRGALRSKKLWSGWVTVPPQHIVGKLSNKAAKYSTLSKEMRLPFTIACFSAFEASIEPLDMTYVLYEFEGGWFSCFPWVSGVILFEDGFGKRKYTYFNNHSAEYMSNFNHK